MTGETKMRKTVAMSLFAIAAVAANAFAGAEARMAGKILDAVTKKTIPGATIVVSSTGAHNFHQEFKSDKDGLYRILVIDGTIPYDFTFSAPGYQPYTEKIKMRLSEVLAKDVELNPGNAAPAAGSAAAAAPAAAPKADPSVVAFNEGAALYNDQKYAEAAAKFKAAVAGKPDLIAGWEALARTAVQLKDYPTAIEAANKALAVDDTEADMYSILYTSYTATGDKAKAAEAKKKMPANAGVLFNDAARLINQNKDSEAEPLLKQAIAADDKFAQAYYELGMIYVRSQKNADAKTYLSKYLELDPNGKDAATAKEMLKYVQ